MHGGRLLDVSGLLRARGVRGGGARVPAHARRNTTTTALRVGVLLPNGAGRKDKIGSSSHPAPVAASTPRLTLGGPVGLRLRHSPPHCSAPRLPLHRVPLIATGRRASPEERAPCLGVSQALPGKSPHNARLVQGQGHRSVEFELRQARWAGLAQLDGVYSRT